MRILIVEDDCDTTGFLMRGFFGTDHIVEHTDNGRNGLLMAASERFDMVILDRMLAGDIGAPKLLQILRAQQNSVPVLILSTGSGIEDVEAWCDDHLVKPFAFPELLARVEDLNRRCHAKSDTTRLAVGDLELDLLSRQVQRSGQTISVQPGEFDLLEYLMRHAGQIVTRTMLLKDVWQYEFYPQTNVVDVRVWQLRQKVDKPFATALIHTVPRAGYVMRTEGRSGVSPRRQPPRLRDHDSMTTAGAL